MKTIAILFLYIHGKSVSPIADFKYLGADNFAVCQSMALVMTAAARKARDAGDSEQVGVDYRCETPVTK